MELHPRHKAVTDAQIEIGQAIIQTSNKYDLTHAELTHILAQELAGFSKDQIKRERKAKS